LGEECSRQCINALRYLWGFAAFKTNQSYNLASLSTGSRFSLRSSRHSQTTAPGLTITVCLYTAGHQQEPQHVPGVRRGGRPRPEESQPNRSLTCRFKIILYCYPAAGTSRHADRSHRGGHDECTELVASGFVTPGAVTPLDPG
jgi:hypothetical protein